MASWKSKPVASSAATLTFTVPPPLSPPTTATTTTASSKIKVTAAKVGLRLSAILLLIAVGAAGCVQAPNSAATKSAAAPSSSSQSAPAVAKTAPSQSEAKAAPSETAKPPRQADLAGLTAADLTPLLGAPVLKRDEGRAQLWRYRGDGCQLYLFLYRQKKSGAFAVQYSEAVRLSNQAKSSEPADAAETEACITSVWRNRGAGPTS